jgi:hypothetical protein
MDIFNEYWFKSFFERMIKSKVEKVEKLEREDDFLFQHRDDGGGGEGEGVKG